MTPSPPDATSGERDDRPAPALPGTRPARAAVPWVVFAVAVALLAAGIAGWQDARRRNDALRLDVAQRLAAADAALAQAQVKEADLGNQLRDAQAKLQLLEARIEESQSQQASLEALYRDLAPSRDELALNEVEQVLVLAAQQLSLAGNVQAALAALQLADAKLGRLDRPQWTQLRRSLTRDIDQLKAVPYVDVAGIAVKLDQAIVAIDTLPLAKDERLAAAPQDAAPANEAAWQRFLRDAWADLRSLVRIEVSDRPAAPLITPGQAYFLRENLRLRLLSARLALLSRDDKSFKADLAAANAWLRQYFDLRTKSVEAVSSTLTQLAATPMPAEMPDLSQSIDLVRTQKAIRERTPDRPPDRVPAAGPARAK